LVLEEAAPTLPLNLGVVHEDIRASVLLDEAPTLLVVEPLNASHCHRNASTSHVTAPEQTCHPLRGPCCLSLQSAPGQARRWQRRTLRIAFGEVKNGCAHGALGIDMRPPAVVGGTCGLMDVHLSHGRAAPRSSASSSSRFAFTRGSPGDSVRARSSA